MIGSLIYRILYPIKLLLFKIRWKRKNKNNKTNVANIFREDLVKIGLGTYGKLSVKTYPSCNTKLIIGNYCSIAENVSFILGGEHKYNIFSTYPFDKFYMNKHENTITKGDIVIESDVWIGFGATILSGVKIGQGAIIGAGCVVTKNVPPYAIIIENKILKYRFEEEIIKRLVCFNYSNLTVNEIRENYKLICGNINNLIESDFFKKHETI